MTLLSSSTSDHRPTNSKAVISLDCGILTVSFIPILTLLVAPCGFPLAMLSGISAIVVGNRSRKEIVLNGEKGSRLVQGGLATAWIGLVLNFLLMLLKLSMFVVMFGLPLWAILQGSQPK
jgi:hypothetical protein